MKIKRLRYNRRKVFLGLFLFLSLLGITVGYALITTKLTIDGVATVKDAKWDVHFTNFQAMSGSVAPVTNPTITNTDVTFSAKLDEPGDFYGFTIDVTNQGTINADIGSFTLTPDFSAIDYIDATVAYNNGNPIETGDVLAAGQTKKIKVLLKYKEGIDESLYPSANQIHNVTLSLDYEQYTGSLDANFTTDSWKQILIAYDTGNITQLTEAMNAGTTRAVELDLNNDGTAETTANLRIANLSTPSECSTTGFSQTACGFVIEFADIITKHQMNPYTDGTTDGDGTKGGWEHSDMRTYLNSDIYNALPSELSSKIKDTTVVSGHGSNDATNFTTVDKLYLLDAKEIYGTSFTNQYNAAKDNERQLDYYANLGVTTENYSGAIKQYNGSNYYWWLRSAHSMYNYYFYHVNGIGNWGICTSNDTRGVSPAFRIAK